MSLQFINLTKQKPEFLPDFRRAYDEIFIPRFPDWHTPEYYQRMLERMDHEQEQIAINLLVHQDESGYRQPLALGTAFYYPEFEAGILAFNATLPGTQIKGLGKAMVDGRIQSLQEMAQSIGKKLRPPFLDINDPRKIRPEDDVMDPSVRKSIFESWGARTVPVDYVQPPVTPEGYYNDTSLLMNYPINGYYATPDDVEAFLRAIYTVHGGGNPDTNFHAQGMFRQLDEWRKTYQLPVATAVPGYKIGMPKFEIL
jgi:hypothetical protein